MNNQIAIYPGSFDPITNGHMDVIRRGLEIFDRVIIAVARNSEKNSLFTVQDRVDLINRLIDGNPRLEVDTFDGLLVDYVVSREARIILRGLRAVSDFEYEFQLTQMNHSISPQIETLFMMTSTRYGYLSSSIVKEVASLGGDISKFVPPQVAEELRKKFS
ncbi:pantetheine-phosphate adenylyltransferase [Geopsychrobacter electrodiphilus]|uniref:pantetheine-phosphate adenylyltransferase n=1 Tax=Geopsychrobacter electrodiphilus TaxID=225196 RepID=UPI00037C40A5|nr:pantetheine-phosphate adenylyltransferase [Geopsychrobacter electrodiphilus]